MKTAEEIATRMRACTDGEEGDFFGSKREILICCLPYEHAKEFLVAGVDRADWPQNFTNEAAIREEAEKYIPFALQKAMNHRGLSAARAVDKFQLWAWLLGTEEQAEEILQVRYPMYGVPTTKRFAEMFGMVEAYEAAMHDDLRAMANGEPCSPDCAEGCSQ